MERTVYREGTNASAPRGGLTTGHRVTPRRMSAYCQQWQRWQFDREHGRGEGLPPIADDFVRKPMIAS